MNTENTEYLTVREVAEKLNLCVDTVYRKCKERKIGHTILFGNIRIKKTDIETIEEKNYIPRKRERAF